MTKAKYIRPESRIIVLEDSLMNIVDATNGKTQVNTTKPDGTGDAGTAKSKQNGNIWDDGDES